MDFETVRCRRHQQKNAEYSKNRSIKYVADDTSIRVIAACFRVQVQTYS
jgi:hypothetical protein